jgi:predicted enzyme related to lactoylglutathione lyase
MLNPAPKFVGVELYFDGLHDAKQFYTDLLGLKRCEEQSGHHAKFDAGSAFICLERKGSESYPSRDKAVLFFEVSDLVEAVEKIGRKRFVRIESGWAVMHDPEGHNLLLLQKGAGR